MRYVKLMAAAIFIISSCSKNNSAPPEEPLATQLTAPGSWRISTLVVGIIDESPEFDGYSFVFTKDGKVNVNYEATNVQGMWNIWYADGPTTQKKQRMFRLSLPYSDKFSKITKDWPTFDSDATHASFDNGLFILNKN